MSAAPRRRSRERDVVVGAPDDDPHARDARQRRRDELADRGTERGDRDRSGRYRRRVELTAALGEIEHAGRFDEDDAVDVAALGALAGRLLDAGATGLVALGTTGEAATLTPAERELVVDDVRRRLPVRGRRMILGAGTNSTRTTLDEVTRWNDIVPEAAALLVVVPYYTRPSEAGAVAHLAGRRRRERRRRSSSTTSRTAPVAASAPARSSSSPRTPNVAGVKQAVGAARPRHADRARSAPRRLPRAVRRRRLHRPADAARRGRRDRRRGPRAHGRFRPPRRRRPRRRRQGDSGTEPRAPARRRRRLRRAVTCRLEGRPARLRRDRHAERPRPAAAGVRERPPCSMPCVSRDAHRATRDTAERIGAGRSQRATSQPDVRRRRRTTRPSR